MNLNQNECFFLLVLNNFKKFLLILNDFKWFGFSLLKIDQKIQNQSRTVENNQKHSFKKMYSAKWCIIDHYRPKK